MPAADPEAIERQRHECEVRHVAGLATNGDRVRYLLGVTQARGQEASAKLRADVWTYMKQSKAAP